MYHAQHLVLDLHHIARIEEGVGLEGGRLDPLGVRVEHAQRFEAGGFGGAFAQNGSRQSTCVL